MGTTITDDWSALLAPDLFATDPHRPAADARPMVVHTARDKYVLKVGLALFQTGFTVHLGHLSTAAALSLIPSVILFGAMRRNFVKNAAANGMKE